MELQYFLPESVVLIEGTIERIHDEATGSNAADVGEGGATVSLSTRGDVGNGLASLDLSGGSGDDEFTVELTGDGRLTSVAYKSTGVGARVVAAATTLVATVAGVALRAGTPGGGARLLHATGQAAPSSKSEREIREAWDQREKEFSSHKANYERVLKRATSKLLQQRRLIVDPKTADDALDRAAATVRRLEAVAADARAEIEKVDGLYRIWRESQKTRSTESRLHSIAVDSLPLHRSEVPDVSKLDGLVGKVWDDLGVLIEIGPADGFGEASVRPAPHGSAQLKRDEVAWRTARPVRLWVWQRTDADPELRRTFEARIVDKHSAVEVMKVEKSFFGAEGGSLTFDDMGSVTKIGRDDSSALGSLADALKGVPASVASALEDVAKADTAVTSLRTASQAARLSALQREFDTRSKELEMKGLEATSADFVELKVLERQAALVKAQGEATPAPESELTRVQNELALLTARNGIEAAVRQHALDSELAGANAEIARLTTALKLKEASGP